jgi:hypothetical protein
MKLRLHHTIKPRSARDILKNDRILEELKATILGPSARARARTASDEDADSEGDSEGEGEGEIVFEPPRFLVDATQVTVRGWSGTALRGAIVEPAPHRTVVTIPLVRAFRWRVLGLWISGLGVSVGTVAILFILARMWETGRRGGDDLFRLFF